MSVSLSEKCFRRVFLRWRHRLQSWDASQHVTCLRLRGFVETHCATPFALQSTSGFLCFLLPAYLGNAPFARITLWRTCLRFRSWARRRVRVTPVHHEIGSLCWGTTLMSSIQWTLDLLTYSQFSSAAAAAVILRAFHERPNFYSASVYLAQSNACLMV